MCRPLYVILFCLLGLIAPAGAAEPVKLKVADPYLDMHTGPGEGYPIFHVVERGEQVEILKRKTEWFKIRMDNGKQGWVPRAQLERTLTPDGQAVAIASIERGDFAQRRWSAGLMGGDYSGAAVMTAHVNYTFTPNLSAELLYSDVSGDFSSSQLLGVNLLHEPFPSWWFSPFFSLGAGGVHTKPRATLVITNDRTNALANAALGVRAYVTRRFVLRAEYRSYVIFSSDEDNEEIEEWKAGFEVFF